MEGGDDPFMVDASSFALPLLGMRALGTTADAQSFRAIDGTTGVELPVLPHVGAFSYQRRYHTHEGVDLYAPHGTPVVAAAGGTVLWRGGFTGPAVGQPFWHDTDAVLVRTPLSVGAAVVINYGEIHVREGLQAGDTVQQGELLGTVATVLRTDKGRPMAMLHVEMYAANAPCLAHAARPYALWEPPTLPRPAGLLDPTPFFAHLFHAHFNGLPLAVVQQRCQPCEDKLAHADWRYMSAKGFLAPGETLMQVVGRDELALADLGVTRAQVAAELCGLARVLCASPIADDAWTPLQFGGQTLEARRSWFVSAQWSPFFNAALPESRCNVSWSIEWRVRHARTRVGFVLSGNEEGGIAHLVEQFGFFEGGLDGSNRYRIDPHVMRCCLDGAELECSPHARAYLARREQHRARKRAALEAQLADPQLHPDHERFVRAELARLDAKRAME